MFRDDDETLRPIPPVRSDVPEAKQAFLPAVPPRQDLSSSNQVDDVRPTDSEFNRYNRVRKLSIQFSNFKSDKKSVALGQFDISFLVDDGKCC